MFPSSDNPSNLQSKSDQTSPGHVVLTKAVGLASQASENSNNVKAKTQNKNSFVIILIPTLHILVSQVKHLNNILILT